MKTLLAILLFTIYTAHAQTWPRNPQTGKIEFHGTIPWPATAKAEVQRRALVRRWYLAKLTDQTAAEVQKGAKTVVSPTLLTYDKLPNSIVLRYGKGPDGNLFGYWVSLTATPKALSYTFSHFDWQRSADVNAESTGFALEQIVEAPTSNQEAALAALRKRLASAVAGW